MLAINREAASGGDYRAFGELSREYADWARQRYTEHSWLIEMAFSCQSLDLELEIPQAAFRPPNGRTTPADVGDEIYGAVAYRDLRQGGLRDEAHVHAGPLPRPGPGQGLCQALIAQAKAKGFSVMRLDTGKLFAEAIGLYQSVGFAHSGPCIDYPDRMIPMMVLMDRKLD